MLHVSAVRHLRRHSAIFGSPLKLAVWLGRNWLTNVILRRQTRSRRELVKAPDRSIAFRNGPDTVRRMDIRYGKSANEATWHQSARVEGNSGISSSETLASGN